MEWEQRGGSLKFMASQSSPVNEFHTQFQVQQQNLFLKNKVKDKQSVPLSTFVCICMYMLHTHKQVHSTHTIYTSTKMLTKNWQMFLKWSIYLVSFNMISIYTYLFNLLICKLTLSKFTKLWKRKLDIDHLYSGTNKF